MKPHEGLARGVGSEGGLAPSPEQWGSPRGCLPAQLPCSGTLVGVVVLLLFSAAAGAELPLVPPGGQAGCLLNLRHRVEPLPPGAPPALRLPGKFGQVLFILYP